MNLYDGGYLDLWQVENLIKQRIKNSEVCDFNS